MTRTTLGALTLAVLTAVALAGCGGPTEPAGPRMPSKVLVVIEENHSFDQMRSGMPYLASLAEHYGYATHWSALAHPSEPNYLALAGGSMFGVTDDGPPSVNAGKVGDASSVFGQALAAGRSAATYAESMPRHCYGRDYPDTSAAPALYATRHNPWVYFSTERAQCAQYDVDLGSFAADAAHDTLPDIGFLVPNLAHDGHDGSLAAADDWLQERLAPVLASSDFTSGRLAVVVTGDEDDGKGEDPDNTVLTTVLHVDLHHQVIDTPLTHYSLTRFMADIIGVTPPGEARDAPDMRAAFGW